MDPTCGVIDKFRDLVLNLIWEQLRDLIYYHRNIDLLNEQLKDLTLERSSLQHRIDEAENNREGIFEKVRYWLGEVNKLSEQVQKFHEESQAKTECNITSCPNPWLRYKLSKRAKSMTEEVAKVYAKRIVGEISFLVPPPSMVELTNREGNEGISRVPIMNQILEELRNPDVNMIGLCGLPGVGKTTIAKKVAKNQKIFEKVVIATVSPKLNIGQIQDQIAEALGMQLDERTEYLKAYRLSKRLENEKNILLILDDLWQGLDLGKVGIPFVDVERYGKINEGCKILLTSRNEKLLSKSMKCQKIITVGVLSEDEAWELFQSIAKLSIESSSPDLKPIATEIVQKCGGLPLAIATAKALKDENRVRWEDFLLRLKHPLARSVTGIKEVDTILKLSYEPLSQEEKYIFLLSAMLSHDPSIDDLLVYSMGLDVLKHPENMGDAHTAIFEIVGKLKSLNLFLDSFSSHHFTMHDFFRDVALSIASKELNAIIERHKRLNKWPSNPECCKGICLQECDICDLPEELNGPMLEFLLLNSNKSDLTIPNMFFKSSKKLKVLAITKVNFLSLPSLIFLQRLKVLCLHSCLLKDIIEIRNLRKLEVLSLAYSEIQRLPIEVAELTSLQMLNLSHCSKLKVIPQKLLSSLKKLEALYMGNSFNEWKVEDSSKVDENASVDELRDLPISSLEIHIPNISMLPEDLFLHMNLNIYKISIGKHWKWQDNYKTSKISNGAGVPELLEGVEDLYLNGCNAQENVLHSHEGRGFPHLRHLQMDFHSAHHEGATKNVSNKTIKSLFNSKALLPKLEMLELSNLLNILTPLMWDDHLSHNSFNNLKVLVVKRCGFVKLVPLHVLKSLNNLEEVEVEYCDMLEIVFDFEDLNDYYKEMESSSVVVPLKKLKLRNLLKLKNVWSDHYQGNVSFPSLKSVDVYNCKSLTSIFPASIAKDMLRDVEELQISNCSIDVIVTKNQVSEFVGVTFGFPRLTSLMLSGLPNLRNFYPQKHTLEWPNLQRLSIQNCDELEIFEKEVSSSSEIYEEESTLNSKYPLFSRDKVIHNLEEFHPMGKLVEMIGSGQFPMYHFPKVKLLRLYADNATTILYRTLLKSFPNLEELQLSGHFVGAFGGDDVVALTSPFPKLTLERIPITGSLSPILVSSPNLTHIEVTFCIELTTLMTSSTARSLVHLTHLSIGNCIQIEEIITKQEGENDEDKEIVFIKLKTLVLYDLYGLKRFCGYNYTFRFPLLDQLVIKECPSFKIFSPGLIDIPSLPKLTLERIPITGSLSPILVSSPNLTHIEVTFCIELTTLMTSSTAQSLVHLTYLSIGNCTQIEEIITKQEGENDEDKEIVFVKLKTLVLYDLYGLKRFCGYNYTFRFPLLDQLVIKECPSFKIFSPGLIDIPSLQSIQLSQDGKKHEVRNADLNKTFYQKRFMGSKEVELDENDAIMIRNDQFPVDCYPEVEILQIQRFVDEWVTFPYTLLERFPKLNELHVWDSSFREIFPSHAPSSTSFRNLTVLKVDHCGLTTLMTSSAAQSLVHITHLYISNCFQIEEIITKQEGEDDEDREIIFNQMKILKLDDLPRLKRFCGYNYTFRFPLLEHVTVTECPRLTIFCPGAIHAPQLQIVGVHKDEAHKDIWMTDLNNTIQHLFTFEEVISTCRSMALNSKNITMIPDVFPEVSSLYVESFMDEGVTFPYSSLERFPKLDELNVEHCSFEEIFPSQDQIIDFMGKIPPFKVLYIAYMDKLKSIWKDDSQLPPIHQNLTWLQVKSCCSLAKLAPSSASFQNLRELYVSGCHHLIHLVTTLTAKSLVSLGWLKINDCKRMEEIVMNETNEDVQGGVTFNQLKKIKLTNMPSLKMFSSQSHTFKFPELEKIKIIGCPEMKMFCRGVLETPRLSTMKIEERDMKLKDEGDLNKTIETLSPAKGSINI